MISNLKLLFVVGAGGVRADFISGWLGTLPNFVNNRWLLDPESGVSYGNQGDLREIDFGRSLESLLEEKEIVLSKNAKFTWAVACHGHELGGLKKYFLEDNIKFLEIDPSGADKSKINWEFYVKTFLSHRKTIDTFIGTGQHWIVDSLISEEEISDDMRIAMVKQRMKRQKFNNIVPESFNPIRADYSLLFDKPDGSKYLTDLLGLKVDNRYHQFYDSLLPFANSPSSIERWGTNWVKEDYFK